MQEKKIFMLNIKKLFYLKTTHDIYHHHKHYVGILGRRSFIERTNKYKARPHISWISSQNKAEISMRNLIGRISKILFLRGIVSCQSDADKLLINSQNNLWACNTKRPISK